MFMQNNYYDEDFKKSIVSLYHNGKSQTQLSKEYGVAYFQMDQAVFNRRN